MHSFEYVIVSTLTPNMKTCMADTPHKWIFKMHGVLDLVTIFCEETFMKDISISSVDAL